MQRLRASEMGSTEVATEGQKGVQADGGESEEVPSDSVGGSSVGMSNEVTVENTPVEDQERNVQEDKKTVATNSLPDMSKPLARTDSSTQTQGEEQNKVVEKKATVDVSHKMAAVLSQGKPEVCQEPTSSMYSSKVSDCQRNKFTTEKEATDKKATPDTPNRRRMAANLSLDHGIGHSPKTSSPAVEKEQAVANEEKAEAASKQEKSPGSWCQTQLPETVAERQVGAGTSEESSPGGREREEGRRDKSGKQVPSYAGIDSSSLGRKKTVYVQEQKDSSHGASCKNLYCAPYSVSSGAAYKDLQGGDAGEDWQMDSVIEQIEKQMVAVLEKIEGDMPSLLEQIRDYPECLPKAKSAQSSPSFCHRSYQDHCTPPPLPTTPRPPMPSLPHLTIPPPSYPPPNPPTQTQTHNQVPTEQDDRDGQRDNARLSQSPREGGSGRGL